jgi:TRAP-type uncharacterized transport system substrate-binding protein
MRTIATAAIGLAIGLIGSANAQPLGHVPFHPGAVAYFGEKGIRETQ